MAATNIYVSNTDGNFSTSSVWGKATNKTAAIHASTNITPTVGGVNSATFTAPNITGNKSVGVVVYAATLGTGGGDWTATLQEDSGAGFVNTTATATITNASRISAGFMYFKWGTPYAYAVATANKYRVQLKVSIATSGTAAADSGGANFFFFEYSDIGGTPTTGDDIIIISANQTGTRTITVTGTSNLVGSGSGSSGSTAIAARETTDAVRLEYGGSLVFDTLANSQLQIRGGVYVNTGGTWTQGTLGSPMPSTVTSKLIWDSNLVSGLAGMYHSTGGIVNLSGAPAPNTTDYHTSYVSGSGTTGSPLAVPSTWNVGDRILITDKTTLAQNEDKYIKTKPTSTTATLSDTPGGAESGLAFTHNTWDEMIEVGYNVIWTATDTATGWYYRNSNTTAGGLNIRWFRCEYMGTSNTSKSGFQAYLVNTSATGTVVMDYVVAYQPVYRALYFSGNKAPATHTGLIVYGQNNNQATGVGGFYANNANNKIFNNVWIVGLRRSGFELAANAGSVFNNVIIVGCNQIAAAAGAGIIVTNPANLIFNNLEIQSCGAQAISLSGANSLTFNNMVSGTHGNNTIDIACTSDFYETLFFNNSTFNSTTFISNYLGMVPGSIISFQTRQTTTNRNSWYTAFGSAHATGSGLTDTFVRTPGSLALKIASEDNVTGFEWDEYIPVDAHNTATFQGYFGANTALAGDGTASARVELWLPGAISASATQTISLVDVTGGAAWPSVSISAQYTGSIPGMAIMKVFVLTVTSGAYLYVDDTYNAGNTIVSKDPTTGLDVWVNGLISPVLAPSTITPGYLAAAVWDEPSNLHTTSGSMGLKENQGATKGDLAALD